MFPIVGFFIQILMFILFIQYTDGSGCPSGGPPSKYIQSLPICKNGRLTGSSILLDFFPARHIPIDQCDCTVLVYSGRKLSFSPVFTPSYVGCGSEIHLQRYIPQGETQVITCMGGTTFAGLDSGHTISITLVRTSQVFDTSYCYRLDIEGTGGSMSLSCQEAKTTTAVSLTTTSSLEVTSEAGSNLSTCVTADAQISGEVMGVLNLPGTVSVMIVVSLLLMYSAVITSLYLRLLKKRRQEDKIYNEIYEEIPAKPTVQKQESRVSHISNVSSDRVLPTIPQEPEFLPGQYCTSSPPPSVNSVTKQSHWNWTYQEKTLTQEYEYANQAF